MCGVNAYGAYSGAAVLDLDNSAFRTYDFAFQADSNDEIVEGN